MASITPKLDLIRTVDALKINPLTRQPIGRGQHIYAYCNIRTNQVIYSLTQILSPRKNLRQLPNAGNNTKPPKLRKDLWRPLWTLTLPAGFQGEAQGLAAWKRLNALRYMHELYWTPPKELARNKTEEELEEIQEMLDDRGGSKKENVYDVVKREKKKLRLRQVMNQKANSVADLAAVLVEQEQICEEDAGEFGVDEVERMLKLDADAKEGALEELESYIERLEQQIKELVKLTPVQNTGEDGRRVKKMRELRYKTRKTLRNAQSRKEEMEYAMVMASMVPPREIELQAIKSASETEEAEPEVQEIEDERAGSAQEASTQVTVLEQRVESVSEQNQIAARKHPITIPKPAFTMEGVKVTWQNILDAEYAPAWPASVEHDWMGITRHAAPKPGVEPSMTAQEFYESKRRVMAEEEVEEETNVREGVVKSVSAAIIRELIGRRRSGELIQRRRSSGSKRDAGDKVTFQPEVERESVKEVQ